MKQLKASTPDEAYGHVTSSGPMGLEMPDELATAIEASAKGLPKDFEYRRIGKAADKFEADTGERSEVSVITTSDPDREGDVILADGIDWKSYNRVVPFAHKYSMLPVGSCLWMKPKDNGLIAKTAYFSKPDGWPEAWLPDAIVHLQRQNPPGMTAKSVGILPLQARPATMEEKAMNPGWGNKRIINKSQGFEYSACVVPVNPAAEMIAIIKALKEFPDAKTADLAADLAAQLLELPAVKDMIEDAMPPCPKCKSAANVIRATGTVGASMKCNLCDCNATSHIKETRQGKVSFAHYCEKHLIETEGQNPSMIQSTFTIVKDGSGGTYQCSVCNLTFDPAAGAAKAVEDERIAALLKAAVEAPYYTPAAYASALKQQQAKLAEWAEKEAQRQLQAAFWMMSGKV